MIAEYEIWHSKCFAHRNFFLSPVLSLIDAFKIYFYYNTEPQISRLIGADQYPVTLFTSARTIKHIVTYIQLYKRKIKMMKERCFIQQEKHFPPLFFFFLRGLLYIHQVFCCFAYLISLLLITHAISITPISKAMTRRKPEYVSAQSTKLSLTRKRS